MASADLFKTSLGAHGSVAHRREHAFDDVARAQMLPVLGREVVESEQRIAILDQAFDRLVVFNAPGFDEGVERHERIFLVSAIQISCRARLAFDCWLFGSLLRTLAVLCTQQR